ncbi:MAG: XdhC family protein [Verrucomicrobiae bacterium]|nr:XdhC family protein [Verrucomicrobiae bacterium]
MKSKPDRRQIDEALRASLADGMRPVLATVLQAQGSTPLATGAKAVIAADGSLIAGTIGGGLVESEAQQRAITVAARAEPEVFDFHLHGPGGTDAYPVCGGTVRTLLQPVSGDEAAAYTAASRAASDRLTGTLTTSINSHGDTVRVTTEWREGLAQKNAAVYEFEGNREWLHESVVPVPLLLIVGAGHVGQALAAQAHLAGFEITVVDDRPELLAPELFPGGAQLVCGAIAENVAALHFDNHTFVALVNRGHRADAEALAACIHKPCAYLGMIGSRRKARLMRDHFLTEQLATAGEFDRVRIPIGLDIGAETAPEIAAAIVAQLIEEKNRAPAEL